MKFIYDLAIFVFVFAVRLISPFSSRARLWTEGRKDWKEKLRKNVDPRNRNIWMHCASLGEFEQGRPLIEAIRKVMPEFRIILSFFSPSGYEIRKNYGNADYICYLPADTPHNATEFIRTVNPAIVLFIRYEFWYNFITALGKTSARLYLVSGAFRPGQHFFRWYGGFFRKELFCFTHIFVQDRQSSDLLKSIGINNVSVTGDTRFDRVIQIAQSTDTIRQIEQFRGSEKLFMAGSSWPEDEEVIVRYINSAPDRMKWVFAPHEIAKENIGRLEKMFTCEVVRFSRFDGNSARARVLIIDNIGLLASAYRYAYIAEIGGGFGNGIHNVLEAACWGVPTLFGPDYKPYVEAVDLIKLNAAKCFKTFAEFSLIIDKWLSDEAFYLKSANAASLYVKQNTGATAAIMAKIGGEDINMGSSKLVDNKNLAH
ncbi:MAG: glycosyltransferase N-terminal domain-containing protein [Bacteroidales bacterium]